MQATAETGHHKKLRGVLILCAVLVMVAAIFYFSEFTVLGGKIFAGVSLLMLFYGFLAPLYFLIRLCFTAYAKKHPGAQQADAALHTFHVAERSRWRQLVRRLTYIKPWKLILGAVLLVVFGALVQHWRFDAKGRENVVEVGATAAFFFWILVGFELLHHAWEWLSPKLFKNHVVHPHVVPEGPRPTVQIVCNVAVLAGLVFALLELLVSGADAGAVLFSFIAPGVVLLLLYGFWFVGAALWNMFVKSRRPANIT